MIGFLYSEKIIIEIAKRNAKKVLIIDIEKVSKAKKNKLKVNS